MKKTALLCTGILMAGVFTLGCGASAAPALTPSVTQDMGGGAVYAYYDFEWNGSQKLFTIACDPAAEGSEYEFVVHHISNGQGGYAASYVADIAADFEESTGRKVLAATNGDFFMSASSGVGPVESYVKDGIVLNLGAYSWKHCFGFDNNGNTAIGRLDLNNTVVRLNVTSADGSASRVFEIDAFNQEPEDGELAVYTNTGTFTVNGAAKYVIVAESANTTQYPVYGTSRRTVEGEVISDGSFTVSSGQYAIVVKGDNEISRWLYENLYYGAQADIVRYPAGEFEGMEYVVGGWDILIEDCVVNEDCRTDTENSGGVAAPRTFFGVKEDGTMVLCALDGRQTGYSVGLTVQEEAYLAEELGLVTAIELDGGGSTTFLLRQDDELTLMNSPSDATGARRVCNAVLLVEKEDAQDGEEDEDPPSQSGDGETTVPSGEDGQGGCAGAVGYGAGLGVPVLFAAGTGATIVFVRRKKKGN